MTDVTGPSSPPPRRKGRTRTVALLGTIAALAVAGVVYATLGQDKTGPAACAGSAAALARLDPLVRGEVAALNLARPTRLLPALSFEGPDGTPRTLADFKGRTVLLNLWATWCIPCRKEMPALDRLQKERGGTDFQVVAVNTDTARLEQRQAFLTKAGVTSLPLYADATGGVLRTLKAFGLPTTLLVDANGCELGTLAGPAAWDSADAEKLIDAAKAFPVPQG